MTQAVKTIASGIENAQDKSFQFPSFTQSTELLTILRFVKLDTELGRLFFTAYLFPLRVPSEALTAKRAFSNDPITQFIPEEEKPLAGVCSRKKRTSW